MSNHTNIWIIHNPAAGWCTRRRVKKLLTAFASRGIMPIVKPTLHPGHAIALAAEACRTGASIIVAAGGDGTLNEVVNGMLASGLTNKLPFLAVFPVGTVNLVARELNVPSCPDTFAARVLTRANTATIWPAQANGRYFVAVAGVGIDAYVVNSVSLLKKKLFSRFAYVYETIKTLIKATYTARGWPHRYTVEIDGHSYHTPALIVAKGHYYAGGFVVANQARLTDQQLYAVLFASGTIRSLVSYIFHLACGRLNQHRQVTVLPANSILIHGPVGQPVQLDGDPGGRLPLLIEVGTVPLTVVY